MKKTIKNTATLFTFFIAVIVSAQELDTIINVGDYNIHFMIKKGKESPIIFESGSGNDATIWKDIINPIAKNTNATIIRYDRIGYGKSSIQPNSTKNTHGILANVIALEGGLERLGYKKELTFVSHSLGGFYTRLFAERNFEKMKQIIFLDASLPSFYSKDFMNRMQKIMSPKFLENIKKSNLGLYYELLNINQTVQLMQKTSLSKSLSVLSLEASKAFNPLKNEDDALRWKQSHKIFTAKSSNRKSIEINDSSHYIFKSKPDIVISKISDFYNKSN